MGKPGASGFDTPGAKSACHVPMIMDCEHAGSVGVGWADAPESPAKSNATDLAARFIAFDPPKVGRQNRMLHLRSDEQWR
jgi:hypothetical protein